MPDCVFCEIVRHEAPAEYIAEWIHCAAIHGADGFDVDAVATEVGLTWIQAYNVVQRVTDALQDVADAIAAGATKEACCTEEQRHNHTARDIQEMFNADH